MIVRNKLYYPKSHVVNNLTTSGKEWMLEDGTEFKGYYHRYIDGTVLTGASFDKMESKKLIPYVNTIEQPHTIIYDKIKKAKKNFIVPKQQYPILTIEDYEKGRVTRYFIKRRNSSTFEDIFEVNEEQFKLLKKTKGGIDKNLYLGVEIDWKLTGPLNDIKNLSGLIVTYGVYNTNQRVIKLKDREFPGIKNFLTDYTELSIHSKTVSESIKKMFGNVK
jgi:hypothetical protein